MVCSRFSTLLLSNNSPAVVTNHSALMQMQTATSGLLSDVVKTFGCPLGFQFGIPTRCSAAGNMPQQLFDKVHVFMLLEQLRSHDVSPKM